MSGTEVLDEDDIVQMESEKLKSTSRDIDIDVDDLVDAFPSFEHHMTVKAKLRALVRKNVITEDQMEDIEARWQEK